MIVQFIHIVGVAFKCRCREIFFGLLLLGAISAKSAPYLTLVGGNTLNGSQLAVNQVSASGTMGGFTASGAYHYLLFRSGNFTTQNLSISVNSIAIGVNINFFLSSNTAYTVGISGIIPYGTECGFSETITMKIYNQLAQEVLVYTFIVRNPIQAIPVSNFKVYGSQVSFPSLIQGCGAGSKNIMANNIKLQYIGTGSVQKYRVVIKQVDVNGLPVSNGFNFTQNWTNGPVPLYIILNNALVGTTTGTIPNVWSYFLITLETSGGPCSGGIGTHTAFVRLSPQCCPK